MTQKPKRLYCPYCPEDERQPFTSGQGLSAHQRSAHPNEPYSILKRKKKRKKKKKTTKKKTVAENCHFELTPIGGDAPSGFDAEFRLRIVLKIDVEK